MEYVLLSIFQTETYFTEYVLSVSVACIHTNWHLPYRNAMCKKNPGPQILNVFICFLTMPLNFRDYTEVHTNLRFFRMTPLHVTL